MAQAGKIWLYHHDAPSFLISSHFIGRLLVVKSIVETLTALARWLNGNTIRLDPANVLNFKYGICDSRWKRLVPGVGGVKNKALSVTACSVFGT